MPLRHTRNLRDRFRALGVDTNLASALSAQVSQWVQESGPVWTVKRLKLLKSCYLAHIAGHPYTLTYIASRMVRGKMVPKGPFGSLWQKTTFSIRSMALVLNALMVYSTMIAKSVSQEQWEKFHSSMTRTPPTEEHLGEIVDLIHIPKGMSVDGGVALETFEEFVVRMGYSPSFLRRHIVDFVDSDTGMALWEEYPQYRQSFNTIADPIDSRFAFDDLFGYHDPLDLKTTRDPVGRLGFTQEPGYKLRVFASPNICHQLAMSRMKVQLFTLLRRVHWDCTFDQEIGTSWVQEQLAQGKTVWSVDLSDATNNFPLDLQIQVLQKFGCLPEDVGLFHQLSRCRWASNPFGEQRFDRWTVGQPLGLGPSFAAFALTHGIMVHSIARSLGLSDEFRVLGDDIVISEERLATKYMEAMQSLGVPVSKDKTICSDVLAEFAGKVVTATSTINVLKWRVPSDRSFLDVVRLLGPSSLTLLRERQRVVATFISALPEPYGFGWNPWGIPLQTRLQVLELLEEIATEKTRTFVNVERQWIWVYSRLELPYFKLRPFDVLNSCHQGPLQSVSARDHNRTPSPEGEGRFLLSISEMTGAPLKLTEQQCTPNLLRELRRRGYTTATSTTDPRGVTPLEDLEQKIVLLRNKLELLGIAFPGVTM